MFNENKLWKERAGARSKDLGRYLRYIFNGHLVVVLLFLAGSGAYFYQNWIAALPTDFPVEIIMAVILGIFLTYSPVYNFLLEADQVFLIPLENRLKGYFFRSGVASLIFQGYILLMVLAVLMPMFAHVSNSGFRLFLPFFIGLLAVKGWNLVAAWRIDYFIQSSVRFTDLAVRYLVNFLFCFLLFKQANLAIITAMGVVMAFYYFSFAGKTKKLGLKWNQLISHEEKRMGSFYRLANMFTDVPKLKDSVKRRKWLDFFVGRIGFTSGNTYLYLFSRTFLRASDYLGLLVRLTVIGGFGLYFISFGWGLVLITILFLYLTGFQLLPLWNHHQNKLWVDLYPVAETEKGRAFRLLLMVILTVQSILFSLIILVKGEWFFAFIALLAGIAFNYIFIYIYSKNRLRIQKG